MTDTTGDNDPGEISGVGDGSAPSSPVAASPVVASNNATSGRISQDKANVSQEMVDKVMYSDIGIDTLLERLKQSIASARDFAAFLKRRSALEEDHASGLRRLARSHLEYLKRVEVKGQSYAARLTEVMKINERMADNGMQFALSLHQMHEDLNELSANVEKSRKQWKHDGLNAEKRASDAEAAMQKAKARYDGLAEDYDRARTGDTKGSRRLGLKGPKSAEQYEQDILRKVQQADGDYEERVKAAKSLRDALVNSERPQAIRALRELIQECDSGLTLQLQKFATFNEKLFLSNGLTVVPFTNDPAPGSSRSLRDIVQEIDNETDFQNYLRAHINRIPARRSEIKYEKHPTLAPKTQQPNPPTLLGNSATGGGTKSSMGGPSANSTMPGGTGANTDLLGGSHDAPGAIDGSQSDSMSGTTYHSPDSQLMQGQVPQPTSTSLQGGPPPSGAAYSQPPLHMPRDGMPPHAYGAEKPTPYGSGPPGRAVSSHTQPLGPESYGRHANSAYLNDRSGPHRSYSPNHPAASQMSSSMGHSGPPLNAHTRYSQLPSDGGRGRGGGSNSGSPAPAANAMNLPPLQPVFGVSLDDLFERDQVAVPTVVIQCILAIDTFGLDVEGIYRASGTSSHIQRLRADFNHHAASPQLDFRNPAHFFHDVNSVATLLKLFFRELPQPLVPTPAYPHFLAAARVEDDLARRDALHQAINDLPDPHYATMRALVLHLHRVMQHESRNRMGSRNLAVCFAPSLMGTQTGSQIADASLQARVLETILVNATAIFDED